MKLLSSCIAFLATLCSLILIILPGCRTTNGNRVSFYTDHSKPSQELVTEETPSTENTRIAYYQEAKAFDIPLPLGSRLLEDKSALADDGYSFYLSYVTEDNRDQLIAFYRQEMERLGWQLYTHLTGPESLYIYNKPKRHAVILFHSDDFRKNTNTITIYVIIEKVISSRGI